jgi:hypothetical protein
MRTSMERSRLGLGGALTEGYIDGRSRSGLGDVTVEGNRTTTRERELVLGFIF